MGKADLHMHTIYSFDGTATARAVLQQAAHHARLNVIAVTDHDTVRGSLEARALAAEYGIEVITGVEISTREGHVVALFIEKDVPKGLPLIETLARIGDLGGIAIAAHPNHPLPGSLPLSTLDDAVAHPRAGRVLRGIEIFNMNPSHSPFNHLSQEAAARLPLARIGSSDAHLAGMVGAGITQFAGHSATDLRAAIESGATNPAQINFEPPARILLRWLRHYALRKLGWVTGHAEAGRPLVWTRLKSA